MPARLPAEAAPVWKVELSNQGVGGLAATEDFVIVSDRDAGDRSDIFRCLSAADGSERWVVRYPAPGRLDYGNSPRATPFLHRGRAYLYGAQGTLSCVEVATGKLLWRREMKREFPPAAELPWGLASSPLVLDDRLIVEPGGRAGTVVALDPATGKTLWQTPGDGPAFASLVPGVFGGRTQLVGYDRISLGGWDLKTGARIWTLVPPQSDDFNVPTPLIVGQRLVVSSENNGTRSYRFDEAGKIRSTPDAEHFDLAPDTHTPVAVGSRLFGIWGRLFCLDLDDGLKEIYSADDDAFGGYASLIASDDRLLVTTEKGELLLVDARADRWQPQARLQLFEDDPGVYSHPALVGDRLYVRGSDRILCLQLPSE